MNQSFDQNYQAQMNNTQAYNIEQLSIKKYASYQNLSLIFMYLFQFVISYAVSRVVQATRGYLNEPSLAILTLISQLCGNIIPFIWLSKKEKIRFRSLYFNQDTDLKQTFKAPKFILLIMMTLGINFIGIVNNLIIKYLQPDVSDILSKLGYNNPDSNLSQTSMLYNVLITIAVCIVAPITEEFIFRGFILQPLRRYGDSFAIIISAVLFGLIHGNISQTPFALLFGLLAGYVTVKSNSIIPATILHFINNSTAILTEFISTFNSFKNSDLIFISIFLICGITLFITLIVNRKKISVPNINRINIHSIPINKYACYFSSIATIFVVILTLYTIFLTIVSPSILNTPFVKDSIYNFYYTFMH